MSDDARKSYLIGGNLASPKHDIRWGRVLDTKMQDGERHYLTKDCCRGVRERWVWVAERDAEETTDFCEESV